MSVFVSIGIDEWHEKPVDVVDILGMVGVILHQFTYDVGYSIQLSNHDVLIFLNY